MYTHIASKMNNLYTGKHKENIFILSFWMSHEREVERNSFDQKEEVVIFHVTFKRFYQIFIIFIYSIFIFMYSISIVHICIYFHKLLHTWF